MITREQSLKMLEVFDPEIAALYKAEIIRQQTTIDLVASENVASPLSTCLEGSKFTNKNMVGYPHSRFTGGCANINAAETLAISRLQELFGCEYANVQAVNATLANIAVLCALLESGDTFLSLGVENGGHISHGDSGHMSGRLFKRVSYRIDPETERVDMADVRAKAEQYRPKLIMCGFTAYTRALDYKLFSEIAREVGAYLWVDCAHEIGLIAAKAMPSPVPYADIVTFSTQKTLRGPRGAGIILCRKALAEKVDNAVFPMLQAGSKTDMVVARSVLFKECMTKEFQAYGRQVILNAKALAEGCAAAGMRLVTGGTDNHMVLVDVSRLVADGQVAEDILEGVGIIANKIDIPFVRLASGKPAGLRIGSPDMTTRGAKEKVMYRIGELIGAALTSSDDQEKLAKIAAEVKEIAARYPDFSTEWLTPECRAVLGES